MTFLLVLSFSVLASKPTPGQEVKEAQCPGVPLQGGRSAPWWRLRAPQLLCGGPDHSVPALCSLEPRSRVPAGGGQVERQRASSSSLQKTDGPIICVLF